MSKKSAAVGTGDIALSPLVDIVARGAADDRMGRWIKRQYTVFPTPTPREKERKKYNNPVDSNKGWG